MSSKMLIDASHPEETRVVVAKGNRLEDFDFESQHKHQIRGNIYLAKITRVEPSLQAAFVDYGGNRHGFLAFSEIHPDYYQIPQADRQALIEEEAAEVNADFDDLDEEIDAKADKRGRKRGGRRRGRNNAGNGRSASADGLPQAEPVAMEAILAAAEDGSDEDEAEAKAQTALAAANGDDDVVSEALSPGFDGDDSDDDEDDDTETVGDDDAIEESRPRRRASRRHYKIQEVIKRRQIILVQVVKEERGNKGAALTTYLSLAGRYSVLMPNTARGGGISRKITNAPDRKRLKEVVKELDVPKGMGVILRTAGANRTNSDIHRDYEYLMRLWNKVRDLTLQSSAPALVYEEGSLIKRSIRDLYNKDIDEVIVAGVEGYREAKDFMRMLMPSHAKMVKPWRDAQPILAKSGMESQLDKLLLSQVTLKSGGYIIINQTEALVAIDVNSGKSTREHSIENTALATNLEAAEEVARQLRLRDLAGLIVIDFIDMEENRNNRAVEKRLKECLKADRARIQVGRISHFGLLEMSRQRMRSSVLESTMAECSHCGGTGYVRSPQSVALHIIRSVEEYLLRHSKHHITVRTPVESAIYLLNKKRQSLSQFEARFGLSVTVEADNDVGAEMFSIDKGAVSDWEADADAAGLIDFDDVDDAEQIAADEEAYQAYLAEEAKSPARDDGEDDDGDGRSRKRRRRRGKRGDADAQATEAEAGDEDDEESDDGSRKSRRRRRSRGRRGGRNRRGQGGRIPNAEPVGPLADLIAAAGNDNEAGEADGAAPAQPEDGATGDADAAERGDGGRRKRRKRGGRRKDRGEEAEVSQPEVTDLAEAPQPEIVPSPEENAAAPVTADNDDRLEEADAAVAPVDEDEDRPARVRATASTINLDVEPVVSSASETEAKPKRGGWWSRK